VGSEIGSNLIKASIRQYDDEVKETEKEIKGNIKAIWDKIKNLGKFNEEDYEEN